MDCGVLSSSLHYCSIASGRTNIVDTTFGYLSDQCLCNVSIRIFSPTPGTGMQIIEIYKWKLLDFE